jgi:hypothetical protein
MNNTKEAQSNQILCDHNVFNYTLSTVEIIQCFLVTFYQCLIMFGKFEIIFRGEFKCVLPEFGWTD